MIIVALSFTLAMLIAFVLPNFGIADLVPGILLRLCP